MANDVTGNPWVLDTAEDIDSGGMLQMIEFHPAATTNDLDVQDAAGNQLYLVQSVTDAAINLATTILKQEFDPPRNTTGLYLKVIDGGKVYIHWHRERN